MSRPSKIKIRLPYVPEGASIAMSALLDWSDSQTSHSIARALAATSRENETPLQKVFDFIASSCLKLAIRTISGCYCDTDSS